MKQFFCKQHPDDPWIITNSSFPQEAAEQFGEEQGLETGDIVHVQNHGKYKLYVIMEPEVHATKVK